MLRSFLKWTLVVLELFLSAGAFYGGIQLLRDPAGGLMHMPATRFLPEGSVFTDWTVPAVTLLLANGVFPLVVVALTVVKHALADVGHVAVGLVLTGWMVVQAAVVGFGAGIQIVYLSLGLLIFALGVLRFALADGGEEAPHGGAHPSH